MTELTINSTETIEVLDGRTTTRKYVTVNDTDIVAERNSLGVSLYWTAPVSLTQFLTECGDTDLITGESKARIHTSHGRNIGTFEQLSTLKHEAVGFFSVTGEDVEFSWENRPNDDDNGFCVLITNADSIDDELETLADGRYLFVPGCDTGNE